MGRRAGALGAALAACQEVTTYEELADEVLPHLRRALDCSMYNLSRVRPDGQFELVRTSEPSLNAEYLQDWFARDPLNTALLRRPKDRIVHASRLAEWPRLARHPVYLEFAPSRGVSHFLFVDLTDAGYLRPGATTIALMRGLRQSDFDSDDVVLLAQQLPALRAAERRCARAARTRAAVPVLEALLEETGARLVLDGRGDVIWMSPAAAELVGARPPPALVEAAGRGLPGSASSSAAASAWRRSSRA